MSYVTIAFVIVEMGVHQQLHGDGVKDVAFEVEDIERIMKVC